MVNNETAILRCNILNLTPEKIFLALKWLTNATNQKGFLFILFPSRKGFSLRICKSACPAAKLKNGCVLSPQHFRVSLWHLLAMKVEPIATGFCKNALKNADVSRFITVRADLTLPERMLR
jgi:hypothetical protein